MGLPATCPASWTQAQFRKEECSNIGDVRALSQLQVWQRRVGNWLLDWSVFLSVTTLWILWVSYPPSEFFTCKSRQPLLSAKSQKQLTHLWGTLHSGEQFSNILVKVAQTGTKYKHHFFSSMFPIVLLLSHNSTWVQITAWMPKSPWNHPDRAGIPILHNMNPCRWTDT